MYWLLEASPRLQRGLRAAWALPPLLSVREICLKLFQVLPPLRHDVPFQELPDCRHDLFTAPAFEVVRFGQAALDLPLVVAFGSEIDVFGGAVDPGDRASVNPSVHHVRL